MASGTIYGTTSNEQIVAKIEWSSVRYSENKSKVTAELYYKSENSTDTLSGTGFYFIYIGETHVSRNFVQTTIGDSWVLVASYSCAVSHDSDGTKSIQIKAEGAVDNILNSTSCTATVELDDLITPSAITVAEDVMLGESCAVKWTPASASYRYKLTFSLGDWSYTTEVLHPNTTSDVTYTDYILPLSVAEQIPNAKNGKMTVLLYTYSDSAATVQIDEAFSSSFTVTVPDSDETRPAVSMEIVPVTSLPSPFDTMYIQGYSKVKAEYSTEGKYGASIKNFAMSVLGREYSSPYTSEYLSFSGTHTVKGRATDSRGYYSEVTEDVTVIPYSKPRIIAAQGESKVIATRCDADGAVSEKGTYLKIKAKRSYSPVEQNGNQCNFCEIQYRYKHEEGSYSSWLTILASDSLDSDEVETEALLGGAMSLRKTYTVQVRAIDDVGMYSYTTIAIPTERVYMHRAGSKNSLGFGKYAEEENTIDVSDEITTKFRGKVEFAGEKWEELGRSSDVGDAEADYGRCGSTGCQYRVCAGNRHVYVSFNCAVTYNGTSITVNSATIPEAYRPPKNVYAICIAEGDFAARISVTSEGNVMIDRIFDLSNQATEFAVSWMDGYIDYWI